MTGGPRGPTEALDLRAVEAQLKERAAGFASEGWPPDESTEAALALLAHARALRAALQFVFTARGDVTGELFPEAWEHAAAVLAQATDGEAPQGLGDTGS